MAIGTTTNMQWLGGQGGAAVRYTGENGVIVNNSTDKISADFDVVQHKLTQGSNITISNNVISAQQPDVSQFVTSSEVTTQIENAIANVREVPASDSSDLNKVLTADANNGYSWQPVPSGPSGVTDVKVDGTSVVTAGVANITMPSVDQTFDPTSSKAQSGVAVASSVSGKQDIISDLATIRSGAQAGSTAVQPGDLATVAFSGSYNDLSDKPTIPTPTIYTAGNGIDITGYAISAKVDGTTITTNSQGQLVATGGGSPFTPTTTHFTANSTSVVQGGDDAYVELPSYLFPTTGVYIMYGVIYMDMTFTPEPWVWDSGNCSWGPKQSFTKQDAITRAWHLPSPTSPYHDFPPWTPYDMYTNPTGLEIVGANSSTTEEYWWNNPTGVSGVNNAYIIRKYGWNSYTVHDTTSYGLPSSLQLFKRRNPDYSVTYNDFYIDLYVRRIADYPLVPYASLVPANA